MKKPVIFLLLAMIGIQQLSCGSGSSKSNDAPEENLVTPQPPEQHEQELFFLFSQAKSKKMTYYKAPKGTAKLDQILKLKKLRPISIRNKDQ